MKRQNFRMGLLIATMLLFPLTLYYFSPVLIVQGAFRGIITGSFIVFALMFIMALAFGRAYCGWLCPAAGLQEACCLANDLRTAGEKYDLIKHLVWVPWISVIAYLFLRAGFQGIDFFYGTHKGISAADALSYTIYYIVAGIIVLMGLVWGRRAFCHYLCWMAPFMVIGSAAKNALAIPSLRLKANRLQCIECGKCTKECPMRLNVQGMVGANAMDNLECTLCGKCVDSCPKKALRYSFGTKS